MTTDVDELTVSEATEYLKAAIQRVHTARRRWEESDANAVSARAKADADHLAVERDLTVRREALEALDRALRVERQQGMEKGVA